MQKRIKILLVEDNKIDRMAFERWVEREGLPYDYEIVESVAAAREALLTGSFDVALFDYLLADGTALDLLAITTTTPAIIVTGSGDEEIAIQAMKAGAVDYLIKDPQGNYLTTLPATVDNVLWRARAEEDLRQYQGHLEELVAERTEALYASEKKFRNIFNSSSDSIFIHGPQGRMLEVNAVACNNLGYTRQELLQLKPGDFDAPEYAALAPARIQIIQEQGQLVFESVHRRKDGTMFPVEIHSRLIEYQGEICILSVARDITARVQAEQKIKELAKLTSENPSPVLRIKADGIVDYSNEAGQFLLAAWDCQPGEPLPAEWRQFSSEVLSSGTRKGTEIEVGESIFFLMFVAVAGENYLNVYGMDITERKQIALQLQRQDRLAAVGQLAAGIAHDFRNLLTTIILYAQMALKNPNLSSDLVKSQEIIIGESKKAADLVQQILDFSSHAMLDKKPLRLEVLIEKLLAILRRTIQKNIKLTLKAEAEKYLVEADPRRLEQVLMNLALNARDAMPQGGELKFTLSKLYLQTDAEVPVAEMSPGEWICLDVADTGTGMTDKVKAHLFEPFFTTKEVGKGTGLGLAQVYGIIRQHEGYIEVESELGVGTTFQLYLPAVDLAEEEMLVSATEVESGQGEMLLLVEDNDTLRSAAAIFLRSLGYQVREASNGLAALKIHEEEESVELIITDLMMPEMEGTVLMRRLRERDPHIQALGITGYASQELTSALRALGFRAVLHKPFDISDLGKVIRQLLSRSASKA